MVHGIIQNFFNNSFAEAKACAMSKQENWNVSEKTAGWRKNNKRFNKALQQRLVKIHFLKKYRTSYT